jgi:hypothetical protein
MAQHVSEARVLAELETFRIEVASATQFLLAYLTIGAVGRESRRVLDALNDTPLFWNTATASLQQAGLIAIGRVFDQKSPHNIDQLLRVVIDNPQAFSKQALAARKMADSASAQSWLGPYLQTVYTPRQRDFQRLRRHVGKHRKVYESQFRDIRNKLYAHNEIVDPAEIAALFSKTRLKDLQRLVLFMNQLYEAVWQLLHNGRRPSLRPMKYSAARIARKRLDRKFGQSVSVLIVSQAKRTLQNLKPAT